LSATSSRINATLLDDQVITTIAEQLRLGKLELLGA
jgi:hypothetical protein